MVGLRVQDWPELWRGEADVDKKCDSTASKGRHNRIYIGKQTTGKRTKSVLWGDECIWINWALATGLNVKCVQLGQWSSFTDNGHKYLAMSIFFLCRFFCSHPRHPWYLVRRLGVCEAQCLVDDQRAHPFGQKVRQHSKRRSSQQNLEAETSCGGTIWWGYFMRHVFSNEQVGKKYVWHRQPPL